VRRSLVLLAVLTTAAATALPSVAAAQSGAAPADAVPAASAEDGADVVIEVVSGRGDLVTGGDALL
jgi:hypothetical protein